MEKEVEDERELEVEETDSKIIIYCSKRAACSDEDQHPHEWFRFRVSALVDKMSLYAAGSTGDM